MSAAPRSGDTYLSFDGVSSYVEIPSRPQYSVAQGHALTVAAWLRVDTGDFPVNENGYVHWLGKGERYGDAGDQEWSFRMYNASHPDRPQRTSFYLFNPRGGLGVGSYVQEPVALNQWRMIAGVADGRRVWIYRDAERIRCSTYRGNPSPDCPIMTLSDPNHTQVVIYPEHGNAPLRLGTQNFASYFQGGITRVRIWDRALGGDEIQGLFASDTAPRSGLVGEFLLNRDTGHTVADTSGLGNPGRIEGATWAVQA